MSIIIISITSVHIRWSLISRVGCLCNTCKSKNYFNNFHEVVNKKGVVGQDSARGANQASRIEFNHVQTRFIYFEFESSLKGFELRGVEFKSNTS